MSHRQCTFAPALPSRVAAEPEPLALIQAGAAVRQGMVVFDVGRASAPPYLPLGQGPCGLFRQAEALVNNGAKWAKLARYPVALAVKAVRDIGWRFENANTIAQPSGNTLRFAYCTPAMLRSLLIAAAMDRDAKADVRAREGARPRRTQSCSTTGRGPRRCVSSCTRKRGAASVCSSAASSRTSSQKGHDPASNCARCGCEKPASAKSARRLTQRTNALSLAAKGVCKPGGALALPPHCHCCLLLQHRIVAEGLHGLSSRGDISALRSAR